MSSKHKRLQDRFIPAADVPAWRTYLRVALATAVQRPFDMSALWPWLFASRFNAVRRLKSLMDANLAFRREVSIVGTPPQYTLTAKGLQIMLQSTSSVRATQMLQLYADETAAAAPARSPVKRKVPAMFTQESKMQRGPKGRLSDIHTSAQMTAYKQRSTFTDLLFTSFTDVATATDADKAAFAAHKIQPLVTKADTALANSSNELAFRRKWFELYATHAEPTVEAKQSAARLLFYPNTFWVSRTAGEQPAALAAYTELLEYNQTQYTDLCACKPSATIRRQFARLMFHPLRCTPVATVAATVSVQQLCNDLNITLPSSEVASVGKNVARNYRAKHSREPARRDAVANGIAIRENVYTETDRPAILACIQQHLLASVVNEHVATK